MKNQIWDKLRNATEFRQVKAIIDDYIDCYNNGRYQWHLAKLSPNEYYQLCINSEYLMKIPVPPAVLLIQKKRENLGGNKVITQLQVEREQNLEPVHRV